MGPGRPRRERRRSTASCSGRATTTSTTSARGSASRSGSRSRCRTTPTFRTGVDVIADQTGEDVAEPRARARGVRRRRAATARYVRVTATSSPRGRTTTSSPWPSWRPSTPAGANLAAGATVTALDTIEAPPRWRQANLIDGIYPPGRGRGRRPGEAAANGARRCSRRALDDADRRAELARRARAGAESRPSSPAAAAPRHGLCRDGPQRQRRRSRAPGPTAASRGRSTSCRRGDVTKPGKEVGPGAIAAIPRPAAAASTCRRATPRATAGRPWPGG